MNDAVGPIAEITEEAARIIDAANAEGIVNSLYIDILDNHFGFNLTNAWGYLYWNTTAAPLGGQPPFTLVMATAVHPGAWPL